MLTAAGEIETDASAADRLAAGFSRRFPATGDASATSASGSLARSRGIVSFSPRLTRDKQE
jgi:hypothetical protein